MEQVLDNLHKLFCQPIWLGVMRWACYVVHIIFLHDLGECFWCIARAIIRHYSIWPSIFWEDEFDVVYDMLGCHRVQLAYNGKSACIIHKQQVRFPFKIKYIDGQFCPWMDFISCPRELCGGCLHLDCEYLRHNWQFKMSFSSCSLRPGQ